MRHNHEKSRAVCRALLSATFVVMLLTGCRSKVADADDVGVEEIPAMIISPELSNQRVTAFAEDEHGQMWIGTFRGLNRFNVHEYHQYYCNDDSISLANDQITDLYRDSGGRLWVVTVSGVSIYTDKDNFRRVGEDNPRDGFQLIESGKGRIFLNKKSSISEYDPSTNRFEEVIGGIRQNTPFGIRSFIDRYDRLWVVSGDALRRYDIDTFEVVDSIKLRSVPNMAYLDKSRNQLWVTSQGEVEVFDTYTGRHAPFSDTLSADPKLSHSLISLIHPYGDRGMLLCTYDKGLYYYDMKSGRLINQSESDFPFEAPAARVNAMFTDSQKNLWLGTYDQGYQLVYNYKDKFNTSFLNSLVKVNSVLSLATDPSGNVWISTIADGLYVCNVNDKSCLRIDCDDLVSRRDVANRSINDIFIDSRNNVWLSSLMANVVLKCRYSGGKIAIVDTYDLEMPLTLAESGEGDIYVCSGNNCIYCIEGGDGEVERRIVSPAGHSFVTGLVPYGDGKMLAAALMQPLLLVDEKSMEMESAPIGEDMWKDCVRRSVFIPSDVCRDSFNKIWIGTVGNGLLCFSPDSMKVTRVEGAPCMDIASIEEDLQGNLWVSTQYGLGKYDRTSGKFTNYYQSDGTGGNQYYDRSSCVLPDGTMVFGGTHGLTTFNPIDVGIKRQVPLLFQDLKVYNKLINPAEHPEIIDRHLAYSPDITLDHTQNGFSISFAALDYMEQERTHYYYKLDSYDKYWIDAHNNREAVYANLPPGDYTFRVRITNNNGTIANSEIAIKIHVKAAPWLTVWAMLIYLLLIGVIIWLIVRLRRHLRREKMVARRALLEKEQEHRVNKMNMSFFANVSHEFRTPLTMISGPLNMLKESSEVKGRDRDLVAIIQRSVERMLRLVNQLMDFNKLENDTLRLQVERADVVAYVNSLVDVIRINAANKGITIVTNGLEESYISLLDSDKLEKIVANLLANAVKFTSPQGRIVVSFDVVPGEEAAAEVAAARPGSKHVMDAGRYIKITVEDSGPGIPADKREKVFDRYYQLTSQTKGEYNWGTGIGLYYARALAELHHGVLFASDCTSAEVSGAKFTLLLPVAESVYDADEHVSPEPRIASARSSENSEISEVSEIPECSDDSESKPLLLIIDDDAEVIHYLRALLSPSYRVISAFDAEKGLSDAVDRHPDLVISDVVMPGTDGYELCRRIKDDVQLCHIPVILVTAKATVENQVEGLNTGADAYVTKPFDPKYLLALIQSLLSNREKARSVISRATEVDTISDNLLSGTDKAFMEELYALMEGELSNSELDVAMITEKLRISRTKFYYKVKGLTGTSPATFFKTYKLNRAAELIIEGRHTVSEIADMTGFSTLAHFSTSFKKQFGTSPSAYPPK